MASNDDGSAKKGAEYARARRLGAGLSLRDVADSIGVSHVFYGEFERGVRRRIRQDRLAKLEDAIPGFSVKEYEGLLKDPNVIALHDAPPQYQSLGRALARRMERGLLASGKIDKIMSILDEDEDEDDE